MRMILVASCAVIGLVGIAHAQQNVEPTSNDDYMKRVMQAAPPQIVWLSWTEPPSPCSHWECVAAVASIDRPEIPLHTNGSERDIRLHVTKRKVSGGTRSVVDGTSSPP